MQRAGAGFSSWRGAALATVVVLLSAAPAGAALAPEGTPVVAPPVTVLVAAPLGQGSACTAEQPCSLLGAQAVARQLEPDMRSDIDVSLEGGTYDLAHPLTFGAADSGLNGFQMTYSAAPGAHPIISGSYQISGWHLVDPANHIWAAPVAAGFDTRQLYVDGQRVPRSIGLPATTYIQTHTGFRTLSPVLAGWRDVTNVAAVFTGGDGAWTQTSCNIASVSGDLITVSQPCWSNLHFPADGLQELAWFVEPQGGFGGLSGAAKPSYFENAYELLSPGHWSQDTTLHEIFYEPSPGQDMATAAVVAPVLQTLVDVQGTLDAPVHDLTFDGLQFSYATWTQPDTANGFAEMQADWTLTGPGAAASQGTCGYATPVGSCPFASWTRTPAAVVLSATHDVTLSGDTFAHLGGAGLDLEYGSQNDLVEGNEFTDISASAIQLGSTDDPLPSDVGAGDTEIDAYDTIVDNYIHDVAIEYLGGVGIWVGYAQHALISHNQIDDVPYTGISIGWAGWHTTFLQPDNDPNVNAYNVISDNLIFNYMQTLGDGGAIYTNGGQATGWDDELVLSGNVAYGGTNTDFSLYTDTGSKYVSITSNVVYEQPIDSFASGGCHTVGHIRLSGNYFSQLGPLYPCFPEVDVASSHTTAVCNLLTPNQAPTGLLAEAGLEPSARSLLDAAPPSVSEVGPDKLPLSGGQVLVGGSGFDPSTSVRFGSAPATSVTVLSANYLLATAPPGAGSGDVTVTTQAGTSPPSAGDRVSYQPHPVPCVPYLGGNLSSSLLP
ncbi:MAG TPA: IPT/TIG domain-containing protein [Acidimicrobiales bacterium]|jgi:hypothetical protein